MRRSKPAAAVEESVAPSTTIPVHLPDRSVVGPRLGSIRVRADHLTLGAGPDGPPGLEADGVLDEPDRTVGHAHVDTSRVEARRRAAPDRVQSPGVKGIVLALPAIRRADMVVQVVDVG